MREEEAARGPGGVRKLHMDPTVHPSPPQRVQGPLQTPVWFFWVQEKDNTRSSTAWRDLRQAAVNLLLGSEGETKTPGALVSRETCRRAAPVVLDPLC